MNVIDMILREAKMDPSSSYKLKKVHVESKREEPEIIEPEVQLESKIEETPKSEVQLESKGKEEVNVGTVLNELVDRIKIVEESVEKLKTTTIQNNIKPPTYNFTIKRDSNGKIESVLAVSTDKN